MDLHGRHLRHVRAAVGGRAVNAPRYVPGDDTFDVSAYTVPYLVRVTLSNGISAHLRQIAQAELTECYLKASEARIARRAAEIGGDE